MMTDEYCLDFVQLSSGGRVFRVVKRERSLILIEDIRVTLQGKLIVDRSWVEERAMKKVLIPVQVARYLSRTSDPSVNPNFSTRLQQKKFTVELWYNEHMLDRFDAPIAEYLLAHQNHTRLWIRQADGSLRGYFIIAIEAYPETGLFRLLLTMFI